GRRAGHGSRHRIGRFETGGRAGRRRGAAQGDRQGMTTRAGFVAVLGAPNVGKSTLVNQLVGSKVSIVSPKVQTTRARVMGIAMRGEAQVAFLDLPGIFAPKRRLDRAMIDAAWRGAVDADLVLLVIDASRGLDDNTETIIAGLAERKIEAVVAINKIDLVK